MIIAAVICSVAVFILIRFLCQRAYQKGVRRERARIEKLFRQALDYRWSSTSNWVFNGVANDRQTLMDPEEFFGPEVAAKLRGEP